MKALYRSHWHVELDIRHIKTTLGMETLSCKTPEMAEKELWVYRKRPVIPPCQAEVGAQFCGRSSSMALFFCVGSRASTSFRYA
ncbi:transposase [Alloalcanivorax xenomutans]|uniref:transposase n=1 Tax=Alloalcanivorax xenomutans TaxID=1094342 RepID=UPI003A7FC5D9